LTTPPQDPRLICDSASAEGLEGLSIGRLAAELKMSKTGIFAHFGSKEQLQLATVETAKQIFLEKVVQPALKNPRGLPRLKAMLEHWLGYVERIVFRGGCFFAVASSEFDSRPGAVRDEIAELTKAWMLGLREEIAAYPQQFQNDRRKCMNQSVEERQDLLKKALTGNAVFTVVSGLAILFANRWLVKFLGLPDKVSLAILGVSLIVYAAILWLNARRPKIKITDAWIAVILDAVWVIGSYVMIFVAPFSVNGKWVVALLAELLMAFAILQWLGIRKIRKAEQYA